MNNEEGLTEKDAVLGGIASATILVTIGVMCIFIWAPVSHYLGKWNNYWEEKSYASDYEDSISVSENRQALRNCMQLAEASGKTFQATPNEKTGRYDCYEVKAYEDTVH